MEYPPTDWTVFPMEDYDLAVPRDPGDLGVELMAQVRPNGRIQDHYRLAVGGAKVLEKKIPLSSLINKSLLPAWKLSLAPWPRDLGIRQNMATSLWVDVRDLVAAGEARIEAEDGEIIDNEEFVNQLDASTSKGKDKTSASLRWAIGIGDDHRIQLLLQGLPAAAAVVNGKPTLRG